MKLNKNTYGVINEILYVTQKTLSKIEEVTHKKQLPFIEQSDINDKITIIHAMFNKSGNILESNMSSVLIAIEKVKGGFNTLSIIPLDGNNNRIVDLILNKNKNKITAEKLEDCILIDTQNNQNHILLKNNRIFQIKFRDSENITAF